MTQPESNEVTLYSLRLSIGAVNGIATNAYNIASSTSTSVHDTQHKIALLQTQIALLQAQVNALAADIKQVTDK
jgi:hypothetical protein